MDSNTKRSLLVTVVGVTLFVALLRFSDVLAFAARLVDLVLPILAGGILALFINVPMTGLEKRLKQLFRKAKKQPPDKTLHLLSFFITLAGIVLVLEMTDNYQLILPMIITCLGATLLAQFLGGKPLYSTILARTLAKQEAEQQAQADGRNT